MSASANNMRRALAPLLAAALLPGCAAGPDFVAPASPTFHSYLPGGDPGATPAALGAAQRFSAGTPVAPDWWRLFDSPDLDRAMQAALAANPSLQSAQAALRESQENLQAGHGVFLPQLDLAFSARRQKSGSLTTGVVPFGGVFNIFSLAATVSYLLDLSGANRRTVEALAAQVDYQRSQMLATWLTLSGNVANTVIARAAYAEQLRATVELIAREEEQLSIARAQVAAGAAAYASVVSIQSQLASSRATLPALQQRYDQASHLLATLAGRAPSQWAPPHVALERLSLPRQLPLTVPSDLVRRRPDIRAAEALLHVASANVGVASAALFPTVTLGANYATQGTQFEHFTGPGGRFWSTGAIVDQPLFHGGTLVHRQRAALEAWHGALGAYRQTVLSAFAQVADTLTALGNDAQALQAQAEALAAARQAVELVEANYRAGLVGYLDVLVADVQLHRAQIDYIQARALRLQDTAALYLAMGGGWWAMPAPALEGRAR
ncbi:MAG: efflux transporter outer membrane subunit [Telluria sp.]